MINYKIASKLLIHHFVHPKLLLAKLYQDKLQRK